MTRAAILTLAVLAGPGVLLGLAQMPSRARDFGSAGQLYPIIEPDLLDVIETRLKRLDASGEIARTNAAFARRAEQRIRRPEPVAGIVPATETRHWSFDPTVTIDHDIRDAKGHRIAERGQAINPLDFVTVRQALVFIDGDNEAQMAWATARYRDLDAKIIMVDGSPIAAMTAHRRRFYFDQEGRLTARFGIRHTPAVVTQVGKQMRVSEHALTKGGAG